MSEQQKTADQARVTDVIQVVFGTEQEWQQTRAKLIEGLTTIGGLFDDDPTLMQAKAECTYKTLRRIIEDIPFLKVNTRLPAGLLPQQVEIISHAIQDGAYQGIELALSHAVNCMMTSIYDLCTSKLKELAS